jgi:hypothetical protein
MGDISIKGRSPLLKGGRVGFSRAGPTGNLPWVRGTSRPGVKKAPRGAQHKEAIKQERVKDTGLHKGSKRKEGSPKAMGTPRPHMTKSDYRLKDQLKKIQKMPDKKFKSYNPAKETRKSRHGFVHEVHKTDPVKGRIGKKTYKGHWKRYHHQDHPKGKK